jgi:hypothetical protein
MRRTFPRRLWSLLLAGLVISQIGCGNDGASDSPTSPSPTASRDTSPTSPTSPGLTLAGVSVSASSVVSQQEAQGSVSLSGVAPAGGAVIRLSSSNPAAARVPSTVTVAPGASEAAFAVASNTVATTQTVTINASYASVTRSASLTVRPPAISAAFTVISRSHGFGACALFPSNGEADCALDGSSSIGPVERWTWRYWAAAPPLGHTATVPSSTMNLSTKCSFFEGARGGEGPNGDKYIQMEIELTVQDRDGTRSAAVRMPVKMYPNRLCGFNY